MGDAASEFNANVRWFRIEIERVQAALAADAGEFRPAEGRPQVAQEPAVDPGDADLHRLPDAVASRKVARPHRRSKAVDSVVRHGDGFFLLVERGEVGARAENFF